MNATIRNLVIAAPLATAALALGAAPALADPVGPVDRGIEIPDPGDDDPNPGPVVNPDLPQGPGGITDHPPCPTHGVDCGGGNDTPDDEPEDNPGDNPGDDGDNPGNEVNDIPVPTRIDTGAGGTTPDDDGLALAWILAGGAVITVTGAAFAGRSVARSRS